MWKITRPDMTCTTKHSNDFIRIAKKSEDFSKEIILSNMVVYLHRGILIIYSLPLFDVPYSPSF